MGCKTKVQQIKRKNSEQRYVNFPAQVTQAMDFSRGEVVEWHVEDRATMALVRKEPPSSVLKKTAQGLLQEFEKIIESAQPAFKQERTLERARRMALSQLVCLGRHRRICLSRIN